jgi:hypothetical protein
LIKKGFGSVKVLKEERDAEFMIGTKISSKGAKR